jgi:hypothetical protein
LNESFSLYSNLPSTVAIDKNVKNCQTLSTKSLLDDNFGSSICYNRNGHCKKKGYYRISHSYKNDALSLSHEKTKLHHLSYASTYTPNSCLTIFKGATAEYDPIFPSDYLLISLARRNSRSSVIEKLSTSAVTKISSNIEKNNDRSENCNKEFLDSFEFKIKCDEQNKLIKAQKIMEKFGWRPGNGLGKKEQGITAALVVQKLDFRTAVIKNPTISEHEPNVGKLNNYHHLYLGKRDRDQKYYRSKSLRNCNMRVESNGISSTIILTNMVVSGKVDILLANDIKHECVRYGKIEKIVIFETIGTEFPIEESVRIFIDFNESKVINNASIDLNCRWFSCRKINAKSYDKRSFIAKDLGFKRV